MDITTPSSQGEVESGGGICLHYITLDKHPHLDLSSLYGGGIYRKELKYLTTPRSKGK